MKESDTGCEEADGKNRMAGHQDFDVRIWG